MRKTARMQTDLYAPKKQPCATGPTQPRYYDITQLTQEFDVSTRTLRFYEDQGLLNPVRRGRQRLYPPRERTRLKLILRGKRLGLSLADIREIIDMYSAEPGELGQINLFLQRIAERRAVLKQQLRDIDETLAELNRAEQVCLARLQELSK